MLPPETPRENGGRTGDQEKSKRNSETCEEIAQSECGHKHYDCDEKREQRPFESLCHIGDAIAFPVQHRPETYEEQKRNSDCTEPDPVVRRADRNFLATEYVHEHGIKRTPEHDGGERDQEHIVQCNRAFTGNGREQCSCFERRRAQSEQQKCTTGRKRNDAKDIDSPRGIDSKGVYTREHARADKKGSNETEREGQDREQNGPTHERAATLERER